MAKGQSCGAVPSWHRGKVLSSVPVFLSFSIEKLLDAHAGCTSPHTQKESIPDDMLSVYVLAYIAIIYQHKRLRFVFHLHLLP